MKDNLDFSQALEELKDGAKIAREGWNGKGMWLVLVHGSEVELRPNTPYGRAIDNQTHVRIDPHIDMRTAQGTMQPGWLASQADLLAEDWVVVE